MGLELGGGFLKMIEERMGRRLTTLLIVVLYAAGLIWGFTQIFGFVLPILRVTVAWLSGQGAALSSRVVVFNLLAALISGVVLVPFMWIATKVIMRPIERRADQRLQKANERIAEATKVFEESHKETQEGWKEIKEQTLENVTQIAKNVGILFESVALLRQLHQQDVDRLTALETRVKDSGKEEKR